MLEYIYLFIFVFPNSVYGHCYTIGANPGFSDVPSVTQLTPWMVRVSWKEVVTQRECSDHFLVKYWRTDDPQNVMISKLVGQQVSYLDLEVAPNAQYAFKVVAREIKKLFGIQWDTDDNHSGALVFQTSYDPVDCIWGSLGEWSRCSTTCGKGKQTANRFILRQATHEGKKCVGSNVITSPCSSPACPGTTTDVGQSRSVSFDSVTMQGELRKENVSLEVLTGTTGSVKMKTTLAEDSKTIQVKLTNLPEGLDYDEIQIHESGKAAQSLLISNKEDGNKSGNKNGMIYGIGGFIFCLCILIVIAMMMYKKLKKSVSENRAELINDDYVAEGSVEFHNVDITKVEENIYEPAPGELTLNDKNINIDKLSCRNLAERSRNMNPFFKNLSVD